MAKELLKRGTTSNILRVFLQDSSVTTGAGKTGLTSSSSGLIISTIADVEATATTYTSAATNVETITTLGTFAAPTAGKCRFREVDATNFPGVYEIQIADARFNVSNSTQLLVSVQCTGVAPVFAEYQFILVDLLDTVRAGLTALPNVASGSAGAIITSGTGTAQLNVSSGNVTVGTNNDKTGYSLTQAFPTNFSSLAITGGGAVTVGTNNDKTGYSLTQTFPANFSSLAITAGGIVTANTTQWNGVSVTGMPMPTYTQPTGFLAATFPTTVASTTNITSASGVTLASSQTFSTTGSVGSVTGSVGSVTGAVGSVTAAVTVGTINNNVITAASIATDAIDSDAIAASAVTEIQSGLSTLTSGQVENAVWDASFTSHTTAGTYGGRLPRSDSSNVDVKLTGSAHIAADVHEVQPGTFVDADYDAGSTYAKLATLIEADTPSGYHFTTQALEQAPSGGAGSWPLNTDQTTGLKRMISAVVGVGGETATPGVLEFDMVGETTTLRITQSVDGNDRLTVEEV